MKTETHDKPTTGDPQESAIPGWNVDGSKREPTTTGEWTVVRQVNTWQIVCDGRPVSHQSFDEGLMQAICDAHNAALAGAYKRGKLEGVFASPDEGEINYVKWLEQQLAAEREKVQPLVDALTHVMQSNHGYKPEACSACADAAKVKEGK